MGASLRGNDRAIRDDPAAQDWLTTVVELEPDGLTARVCGAMIDYAEIDPASFIAATADPAIRIVSFTIAEGGYYVDAETNGFDAAHPDIVRDAAHPDDPRTVFGCIVAALRARRDEGTAPFTIMSCDSLPENGHVTRNAVLGLARAQSHELAAWIEANVAFPDSMVDCITPATSAREIEMVARVRDRGRAPRRLRALPLVSGFLDKLARTEIIQRCRRFRACPTTRILPPSSAASPIRPSETLWSVSASTARTGSSSSSCQPCRTGSTQAPASRVSRSRARCGAAIATARPRRARRSRRTTPDGNG